MRLIFILLFMVVISMQSAFTFMALLYQSNFVWILVPCLILGLYAYAVWRGRIIDPGVLLASIFIAVLLSQRLITAMFVLPDASSAVGALLWGIAFFVLSNGFCLGGTALLIRATGRAPRRVNGGAAG